MRALDVEQAVSVCGSKVSAVLVASAGSSDSRGVGTSGHRHFDHLMGYLGWAQAGTSSNTWGCFQVRCGLDSLGKVFLEHPMNTSFKVLTDKLRH